MPLDKEVADALPSSVPMLSWWQRAVLIIFANAVGVLLGGGILAFFGIMWQKSNTTDDISEQLVAHQETSAITYREMLSELAKLKARVDNLHSADHEAVTPEVSVPLLPSVAMPVEVVTQEAPSAAQVEEAKEELQQRMDKALYRQRQLRD